MQILPYDQPCGTWDQTQWSSSLKIIDIGGFYRMLLKYMCVCRCRAGVAHHPQRCGEAAEPDFSGEGQLPAGPAAHAGYLQKEVSLLCRFHPQ